MKRLIPALLLLTFLLGACSTSSSPTETLPTTESATETATEPISTGQAEAAREAVLSDVENNVSARASSNDELSPASNGMSISSSGSVETGDDGRVKINLLPDGTIVRVGPNSSFAIPVLTMENGEPKTKLQLLYGKVFVLLNGGSLDVETPSGVASVRGSLLSVEYDAEKGRIEATCLEGHCALEDEEGDEVELTEGESSYIEGEEDPSDPEMIDREDIEDWLDENPDLSDYLDELPEPEEFPEDFDSEEELTEEETTEEEIPEEEVPEEEAPEEGGEGEPEGWHGSFFGI